MNQGIMLQSLCCNKLVNPGPDTAYVLGGGSSCQPAEGSSQKG